MALNLPIAVIHNRPHRVDTGSRAATGYGRPKAVLRHARNDARKRTFTTPGKLTFMPPDSIRYLIVKSL